MRYRFGMMISGTVVTAASAAAFCFGGTAAAGARHDDAVVRTDLGVVRGELGAGYRTFEGIPYAAPPVGDLRWSSPRPATRWGGTRDATRPGNDCPQSAGFLGDPASETEDCLYLNVTTPRRNRGARLPVIVFVHGGGFYSGSARHYGAQRLAAIANAVVVTPNYRLGVFGFLAHPALGPTSGDYGLEDQQAALRWVRRNAAAFGGDPGDVTLAGESAGSVSVCSHLTAPSSLGLFQRAILASGPCAVTTEWPYRDGNWYPRARPAAELQGRALAGRLGCTTVGCLRAEPVAALLEASAGGQGYGPVYGGGLLPIAPAKAIATGQFARVPVMHGTTRDEHRTFVAAIETLTGHVTTAKDYRSEVRSVIGAKAARVLAAYPVSDYDSPSVALATVWTDGAWACPALATDRSFARYVPTYAFEFADRHAPWATHGGSPTFPTGAFHAADLQYVFEDQQFPGPQTPAQWRLSDRLIRAWGRFAHGGAPWHRFDRGSALVHSLAPDQVRQVDLGREHACGMWAALDR